MKLIPLLLLALAGCELSNPAAEPCRQLLELRSQVRRDSLGWPVRQLAPLPPQCLDDSVRVVIPR